MPGDGPERSGGREPFLEPPIPDRVKGMSASGLVVSQIQGVTLVSFRVASILDGAVVEAIADELYGLVDQQAQRKLVLDFTSVQFLSSSMLGVLIALHKKSKAIKGRVILCGLRPQLLKIFNIMKLQKVLEFADDEQEAFKSLDVFQP